MDNTVETTVFCGQQAVRACTEELELTVVPAWGSNAVSLRSRRKGIELLRVPESEEAFWSMPVLYGIPILFPPNRIEDGKFSYEGTTYQFDLNEPETNNHSHGLVFEEAWELVEAKLENGEPVIVTAFDSARYPSAMRQFPHRFIFRMTFRLAGATLHKTASIVNKSESAFPWGLGYHTTFNFPFRSGGSVEDCTFTLGVDRQWTLNERFLPTGELTESDNTRKLAAGLDLTQFSFDDAFLSAAASGGSGDAVLHDRDAGIKVVYRCGEPFKTWVVYNDDGKQGYVSPEPYTWVTNAPNLPLDPRLTGVQILRPGEETQVRSSIEVYCD